MKRLLSFFILLIAFFPLVAAQASPEAQYLAACRIVEDADRLSDAGGVMDALAKYQQASAALKRVQDNFPTWNTNMTGLRLSYLAAKIKPLAATQEKIEALQKENASLRAALQQQSKKTSDAAALEQTRQALAEAQRKLDTQARAAAILIAEANAKREQKDRLVSSLTAERDSLQKRIQVSPPEPNVVLQLRTENENLKRQLADSRGTAAPSGKADELNRQLKQTQAQLAFAESERSTLVRQVQSAMAVSNAVAQLKAENETRKRELADSKKGTAAAVGKSDELSRQLNLTRAQLALAESNRATLQRRADAETTNRRTVARLGAENESLKRQIADLKNKASSAAKAEELNRQLKQTQTQLALAESDRAALRSEKATLEERLKKANQPSAAATQQAPRDAQRLKQLERERDELQKKLAAESKELSKPRGKAVEAKVHELADQLAALRAKLDVYEAKPVPYTPEELVLFKPPTVAVAATESQPATKSSRTGSKINATLIADARRLVAAGELDKAEAKYVEALKTDDKDVRALSNLATLQAQQNHFDDAEKTIAQALAIDPQDATSLGLLGYLKLRQEKYDEALDALSRAAQVKAQDPKIQNLLGLTLTHKGMRGAAETAFRKALQADPGFADAHANLATVYLTQQPPAVELARWHYQKAVTAGAPRNPDLEKKLDASGPSSNSK